jgi:hypothetical protein
MAPDEPKIIQGTMQLLPLIAVAVVPFGCLAFATLHVTLAGFLTLLIAVAAVLVAEHLARPDNLHD